MQKFANESWEGTNRLWGAIFALFEHSKPNSVVFCGRLAIEHWVNKAHESDATLPKYPVRPINDIDVIVSDLNDINPRIARRLWIGVDEFPKYLALSDPHSKMKIDIFRDDLSPQEIETIVIDDIQIQLVSAARACAKAIYDCWCVHKGPVDPNQFEDARLLLQCCDHRDVAKSWQRHYSALTKGLSYLEAWNQAQDFKVAVSQNVMTNPFKRIGVFPSLGWKLFKGVTKTLWYRIVSPSKW